jgi:hypothetical protein
VAAGSADDRRPIIRSLGDIQTGRSLGESVSLAKGREFTMASVDFTWGVNIQGKALKTQKFSEGVLDDSN